MLGTRAVERRILERSDVNCIHCGNLIKFQAMVKGSQIIANVYKKKKWDHVEHFHADCYQEAGAPHGDVVDTNMKHFAAK